MNKTLALSNEQVEQICEPSINGSRYRGITGTELLVNVRENNRVVTQNSNTLTNADYESVLSLIENIPRNEREKSAVDMLDVGICPVRLGSSGKWLKIPVNKEWETAVVSRDDIRDWFNENSHTNIGARGGRNSVNEDLYLCILDFDKDADQTYPPFIEQFEQLKLTVSKTRQGYHVWFFLPFPLGNKTIAGNYYIEDNKRKVQKIVEIKADKGQVVAPASIHPTGHVYQWVQGDWQSIPSISEKDMRAILDFCKEFDKGAGSHIQLPSEPAPKLPRKPKYKKSLYLDSDDIREQVRSRFDLLKYAQSHMAHDEIVVTRKRTKVGGNGGFFIYHDPYHWYCFSDSLGGDCFDLVGYIKHGPSWFDHKRDYFREVLKIAASFAGVSLPDNHGLVTGELDPLESKINLASPKTKDYWNVIIKYKYELRLNGISQRVEANGNVMDKFTEARLMNTFYDLGFKGEKRIQRAYLALAAENEYHPIKEYLESLQWDGQTNHIENFVNKYIEDEHGIAYIVIKRFLIGAVARTFTGSQNITMVWTGKTGLGKSHLARWLCPLPDYFIEANMDPRDRRGTQLRCVENFIWEWPEAEVVFRNHKLVGMMKELLTRQHIKVDRKYESDSTHYNLANHIATFNDDGVGIFTDTTGNRRYALLNLLKIDHSYQDKEDVNNIWGHAYALWASGEQCWFSDEESKRVNEVNSLYMMETFTERLFNEYFEVIEDPGPCDFVSLKEIIDILRENGLSQYAQQKTFQEIKRIVKKHGFNPNGRVRLKFCDRSYYPYGYRGIVAKSKIMQKSLRAYELAMLDKSTYTGEVIDTNDPFWTKENGNWQKSTVPKKSV